MKDVILFDLDGTLTDSAPGITASVRYALRKAQKPPLDEATQRKFIGPPLEKSFARYAGMNPEEARRALGYYREYYRAGGLFENSVYPGVPEMLGRLRDKKIRLFIATSKPEYYTAQILAHFDLARYFDGVAAASMDERFVEKGDIIGLALRMAGVPGSRAVMIGDRENDVFGAHENGIPAIGVLYGFGSREELEKAGADRLAASPEEIGDLFAG